VVAVSFNFLGWIGRIDIGREILLLPKIYGLEFELKIAF
jgi:hypothetical protein